MKEHGQRPAITADDLLLLATPDAELRESSSAFSFDQSRFKARIEIGDSWQQLLQAHLYLDHVVTQTLSDALVRPDSINISRMSFVQKLELVDSLGLISRDMVVAIKFANSLRNKIAHDLNFVISEADQRDFSNVVPKFLREAVENGRKTGPCEFWELLHVLVLQVEVVRQIHVFKRLQARKSEIRLRTVLEKTPGAVYRE